MIKIRLTGTRGELTKAVSIMRETYKVLSRSKPRKAKTDSAIWHISVKAELELIKAEGMPVLGEKCKLNGRNGVEHLDRVGPYLVITNKHLHEMGRSHRYTLINEADLWVHSIHGSQHAAVVFAQKHDPS